MSTVVPVAVCHHNPGIPTELWTWMTADPVPHIPADVASGDVGSGDDARMLRIAQGDTEALRLIFDRWKLPLLSYFYRSLGSRADAEDLALQTLERVYRAAARYRPDGTFASWLFSIARGELLHELRRRRRKPVVPVPPEDLAGVVMPAAGAAETEELILLALQSLSEQQRSAVLLAAAGDLDHRGIARTLGVSLNHLHVMLHRARAALRARFNQLYS